MLEDGDLQMLIIPAIDITIGQQIGNKKKESDEEFIA
jgi:hypothetical protein